MKILILCPYPPKSAPSQRFRFEQYIPFLESEDHLVDFQSFYSQNTWRTLYLKGNFFVKLVGFLGGITRRKVKVFLGLSKYDIIFIHREAAPLGPPFLEWWIARILRKKVIYDFDDAIWLPNTSRQNSLVAGLKWHRKVKSIIKWSWKISAGNQYLAEFAKKFNNNVEVIPTTIDTDYHKPLPYPETQVGDQPTLVIGWTGTHSTAKYLKLVSGAIKKLQEQSSFVYKIISNIDPQLNLDYVEFLQWRKETEIEDLNSFDIGIMPLPDNEWTLGKCGFKALQYMALEIPTVASPVGVNTEIIEDGVNGLLASTEQEWVEKLKLLIEDPELRKRLGVAGRKTVIERYSVDANKQKYLDLFSN